MKKLIAFIIALCLSMCACTSVQEAETDPSKLQIVCSCFPAYDFAREIAGEKAQISLLLKPGSEVHSYEPSPKDVVRISESDLFFCNGGESEEWVESLAVDGVNVLYMMDCVEAVEESDEGIYAAEDEGEETELDEHVWTSPVNAVRICKALCAQLCAADADNSDYYKANCEAYTAKLQKLDRQFREVVSTAERKTLVFADRFPMRYFALEYGLECFAAFPGCAEQTEPSAKTVAYLIDKVREDRLPAVLYMEFSNEKMADVICEDSGCEKLPFYSAHSVTAEQFENGISYLDLMNINLETLKEALN